jgi:hypothetical protein
VSDMSSITSIVAAQHVAHVSAGISKRFADDPLRSKAAIVPELSRWWTAVCEQINTDGRGPWLRRLPTAHRNH